MAYSRALKKNFSPYLALNIIVWKLFVVPDHYLPAFAPLESTRAHHQLKLAQIQSSRIEMYNQSFLPRTIATWNNLDIQDIDKINLTTFKDNLLATYIVTCNHISMLPLEGFAN